MAKDPTEVVDKTAPAEELVLRDESDEIIDDLKGQLAGLRGQLAAFKNAGGDDAGDGGRLARAWNAGLAPHLATRLQVPAQELTGRLERLIDQADDPGLRRELERCRDIAHYLFDTFKKISASHQLLTESLTAPRVEVEVAEFCRHLENILPSRGTPLPVGRHPGLPKRIKFASRSGSTVINALAELATVLFGNELAISVSTPAEEQPADEPPLLEFRITCETGSLEAGEGEEVADFAMRRGITPNTVVELLYVEKIIELQGGSFSFSRRQGRVYGLQVRLPFEPIS